MREAPYNDQYNTAQVLSADALQSGLSVHPGFGLHCSGCSDGVPRLQQLVGVNQFACSVPECLQFRCAHSLQLEFGDSPLGLKGFVHERIYLEHVRHPSAARDLPEKKIRAQSLRKTM